jgi:hypothetical protein
MYFLEYDAVLSDRSLPMFQRNELPTLSGRRSGNSHRVTGRHILEDNIFHSHRRGNLMPNILSSYNKMLTYRVTKSKSKTIPVRGREGP